MYEPMGARVVHRRDPKEFFRAVYARREFLSGRKATAHAGYYSTPLYAAAAARAAGREPAQWRPKTG